MTSSLTEALRAERESGLDYARGALLIACFTGAIAWEDYERLDRESLRGG